METYQTPLPLPRWSESQEHWAGSGDQGRRTTVAQNACPTRPGPAILRRRGQRSLWPSYVPPSTQSHVSSPWTAAAGDPGPLHPHPLPEAAAGGAAGPRAEPCPLLVLGVDAAAGVHQLDGTSPTWACCTARCMRGLQLTVGGVHITVALGRGGHGLNPGTVGALTPQSRSPGDSVHTSWTREPVPPPTWLLKAARCSAVNPSSFLASTSCRTRQNPPDSSVGAGRCLWGQG